MPLNWSQIESFLEQVGWPELGDCDNWKWWFQRTWARLDEREWFDVLKIDDDGFDTRIRIAMIALRWIMEDFSGVLEDYEVAQPLWDDWLGAAGLDGSRVLAMARSAGEWSEIEQCCLEEFGIDDDGVNEEENSDVQEDLMIELQTQALAFLAAHIRSLVYRGLKKVWGNSYRVAASFWACAKATEGLYDEMLEPVECDDLDASLTTNQAAAINRAADSLFDDVFDLGEYETSERLAAVDWVTAGCPIFNRGMPEYRG